MTAILDTPERIDYDETHELTIERPQPRRSRPGFWDTLAHRITKHLTRTPRASQVPSCSIRQPFEAPMDRVTREHPWISILALAAV
jgi:hypothetical protein